MKQTTILIILLILSTLLSGCSTSSFDDCYNKCYYINIDNYKYNSTCNNVIVEIARSINSSIPSETYDCIKYNDSIQNYCFNECKQTK